MKSLVQRSVCLATAKYRPEIDGLRALAVLPVVFSHAGFEGFAGGYLGVDIFFVISGYLIGGIIFSELQAGSFSIGRFYERRARRILPALIVVLAFSYVAAWQWMSPDSLREFGQDLVSVIFFASNVVFWNKAGYFAVEAELNPLLHTWSLAVEEQFYIVFPIFLLALVGLRSRWRLITLISLAATSVVAAEVTRRFDADMAFFFFHTRAWELLVGAAIAVFALDNTRIGRGAREGLSAAGLALCIGSFLTFDKASSHPGIITVAPVAGAGLLLAYARPDTIVGRLLCLRPAVWIGLISYSLYLVHQPVFAFMRISAGRSIEPDEFLVPIALCVAISFLMWRYVEQPFRQKGTISTRRVVLASVAASFFAVSIGSAAWAMKGFPERFGELGVRLAEQVRQGWEDRREGVRLGTCQYDRSIGDIDSFLSHWSCQPATEGQRLLIVGDSHSADKAWAMRLAGIDIGSLTGSGCSLTPEPSKKECMALMTRAAELARTGRLDGVVLANRWGRQEVTPAQLNGLAAFWKDLGIPVLIFTPMPEFTQFNRQIARNLRPNNAIEDFHYDKALLSETEGKIVEMARTNGFTVINSADLFCRGNRDNCQPLIGTDVLVIDYAHLSERGARLLGTRIAASPVWQQWVRMVGAVAASRRSAATMPVGQ